MSELTDNLQVQLTALTVLRDIVDERLQEIRQEVQDNLIALNKSAGVKSVEVKLNDETIAGITVVERKQAWHISEDVLLAWVEQNYPTEVVVTKTIRESFKKHLLDTAEVHDFATVVSGVTGEVINGLVPKPVSQNIMVKFKPEGKLRVAQQLMTQNGIQVAELVGTEQLQLTAVAESDS